MPGPRIVRTAVLAVVLGALIASCGSDDKPTAPAETSPSAASATPSPEAGPDQAQAESALLVAEEMPLGFRAQDGSSDTNALGCPGIDSLYLPTGTTGRASISYAHSLSDVFVNETVSVRPSGAAAQAVARFGQAVTECRTFTGTQGAKYQVSALRGLPRYGDGSAALRVSDGRAESRPVDLVAVRVRDLVLVVATASADKVDVELTRTLVQRAVTRAQKQA